ncbi:Yip1-domain-containing protein [Cylindrobasidium torrendii FP15055 ss-10]|uniref:Protein YIP n=1 Tax=Cylindrobasidium torrendii FP15055 ss-10 TaxID=1314674 RepID=A0A0D7BMC3_9AGAR|nr:Yip1-domain-containing protein [Cylindrobasidium torrendii FP15055 ss-10]
MAYVAVEADERLEEGPEGLQFKSFLGHENTEVDARGVGNTDRGYLSDRPHPAKGASGFWTVEYYQPFFDVDTKDVMRRCLGTLLPTTTDFLTSHLQPADLYGPFWTLTTLIFTLFLSSSLAASISVYLSAPGEEYDYDFTLLSIAVSLVYVYGIVIPILLWSALRYIGVGEWSMVEAVAVWGYAMFIWIPVSILCVIPVRILRWVLVGIAFAQSGYFLVRNVYPILASGEAKATRLFIVAIAILHAGIALTFKVMFFSYYVVPPIGEGGAVPVLDPAGNGTALGM